MSTVGPQPPSSLSEKRKRNDNADDNSDSDSDFGPALPESDETSAKKPRVIGPSLPPISEQHRDQGSPPQEAVGAVLEEEDSDEEDDDDFGPSLPPTGPHPNNITGKPSSIAETTTDQGNAPLSKRDDWMMVPPSGGDWSARIDPTKLKNRKFNTGKGAKGPSTAGDAANSWHETPAEKQARLQREMMGIKDTPAAASSTNPDAKGKSDAETAKRLAEYNKSRGPSLYNSHQNTKTETDDDPSAREFDRKKDIGGGLQINATKRKEMLKTASNLGSRFSNAKYL